ncbi:MAG: 3-methyl-2-oxobutanoate hydroxymethyltransferase [Bradymonadia bacterium]|jgi:3-methyl-2-oxobutanoate hydroxymethyltransferase
MKKVTTRTLRRMRERGEPITMVTAYDATFARLLDEAGVDSLLVGDSLGNVIQGRDTTLPVTLEHIIYHCACVARGTTRAHIVADMPFLSYGASLDDAIVNAGRLLKEGSAHAVKLEGGEEQAPLVRRLTQIGIPVMGHLGFTPQSVQVFGGHFVQGREDGAADQMIADAKALEAAGAYGIVLEMVPKTVAQRVTQAISIPTIGIGAGNVTSGQVLVCYDLLGLNEGFHPTFLKKFAELGGTVRGAAAAYVKEVREGTYPGDEHSFNVERRS